ncbi:MAG: tail fiber domain-containing protein [Porticoccaceae bacterium]|nr:tail fiber domain-containing protein [Porticoccaceae bacterium]
MGAAAPTGGTAVQPQTFPSTATATPDWMQKIQHPPGAQFTNDFQSKTFTDPATGATFNGDPRQWQMKGAAPAATPETQFVASPPNINQMAAEGIKGAGMASAGGMYYNPQQVAAGQLSNTDMSQYMNPYTQQVIDTNQADILRGADMGMDALGAQAQAAKSFGGSRHGVAMGEIGRGTADALARSSAGLRQQGFQNAQNAAQSDIQSNLQASLANQNAGLQGAQHRLGAAGQLANISNLGFGMGQTITQNLNQQGQQQQVMNQALIDAAKNRFTGYTGHPQQTLGYGTQAIGASPVPQTTTQTKDPGLMDYLTLAATAYASDERLKTNITKMGQLKSGLNIYKWDWKEGAEKFGADMNHTIGVIAQEAKKLFPEAVIKMDNGYYAVKYAELR